MGGEGVGEEGVVGVFVAKMLCDCEDRDEDVGGCDEEVGELTCCPVA